MIEPPIVLVCHFIIDELISINNEESLKAFSADVQLFSDKSAGWRCADLS
jgi:hypothetical protein